jgi:hypothetical protein
LAILLIHFTSSGSRAFIAFQQVQDKIRPNYSWNNLTVKYLMGIGPNFFPSIGIPALFFVLIPNLFNKNMTNKKCK